MVDPTGPLSYILIVLFILLSAFFAGTESAFSYCDRYTIGVWADDGNKRAKITLKALKKFDDAIITMLILTNVLHVATSTIATILFISVLGDEIGSLVSTLVITILVFFFAEILPKNIAQANRDKWTLNASIIILGFYYLLFPIVFLFKCLIKLIKKMFKIENTESVFDMKDFIEDVKEKSDEGLIDKEEEEIIGASFKFGDKIVGDVLTKRDDIKALDINKCNDKYLRRFLQTVTYSRIPVYRGSIDNIIGILHVRTYLKNIWFNKKISFEKSLLKVYTVNSQITLDEIFKGFKEHKTHIAIVKEKNYTIGMVTMQDVLEELVSNIDETNDGGQK